MGVVPEDHMGVVPEDHMGVVPDSNLKPLPIKSCVCRLFPPAPPPRFPPHRSVPEFMPPFRSDLLYFVLLLHLPVIPLCTTLSYNNKILNEPPHHQILHTTVQYSTVMSNVCKASSANLMFKVYFSGGVDESTDKFYFQSLCTAHV